MCGILTVHAGRPFGHHRREPFVFLADGGGGCPGLDEV
jgi:hypothetical protein